MDANIKLAAVVLASLGAGAAAGWAIAMKRLESDFDSRLAAEIEEMQKFYKAMYKKAQFATPEEAAEEYGIVTTEEVAGELLEQLVEKYQGDDEPKEIVVQHANIFVNSEPLNDEFDYEAEMRNRTEEMPYVITAEEFGQNEKDYNQVTVTYYAEDDVLADEKDEVIDDMDGVIGEPNLGKFGYGSGDRNVVYVRNDRLGLDVEVVRHTGKYAEIVLGFIEHSHKPGIRRFRGDDE